MAKPLCIDLFCGLGGWAEGFLAEGYDVVGFDIERHHYGEDKYPAQLVIQDVLTLHGSQFRNAAVIVASPPCQEFSYMAMPWSRAKQIAGALRGEVPFPDGYKGSVTIEQLRALFDACFRIAQEAGVPLVVENVKGAQPWVGAANAHFGSFYLWGDVGMVGNAICGPSARFGEVLRAAKRTKIDGYSDPRRNGGKGAHLTSQCENDGRKANPDGTDHPQGSWFKIADSKDRGSKNDGGSWFAIGSPGQTGVGQNPDGRKGTGHTLTEKGFNVANAQRYREQSGTKQHGSGAEWFDKALDERRKGAGAKVSGGWFGKGNDMSPMRQYNSKFDSRKAASAQIAKIPPPLSQHIARVFKP